LILICGYGSVKLSASQSLRQFFSFPAATTKQEKKRKKSTAAVNDLCKLCVIQLGAAAFICTQKLLAVFV